MSLRSEAEKLKVDPSYLSRMRKKHGVDWVPNSVDQPQFSPHIMSNVDQLSVDCGLKSKQKCGLTVHSADLTDSEQHWIDILSDLIKVGKLQRIAGSLGKLSSHVWLGDHTMQEIGDIIGTKPALYAR
uniref:Uncharacterized protein n=1 Tax=viral metagenome TaxID=1070528 RepID=A0A6M3JQB2_9ZZZZ